MDNNDTLKVDLMITHERRKYESQSRDVLPDNEQFDLLHSASCSNSC